MDRLTSLEDDAAGLTRRVETTEAARVAALAQVEDLATRNAGLTDDVARAAMDLSELQNAMNAIDAAQWVDIGGERLPIRDAVRRVTRGIQARTARVATANLASMPGESIPIYGVAIVVAATAYELKSSCNSMREMHELEVALGVSPADDPQVSQVCGMQVPTRSEVWRMIKDSPSTVWTAATEAIPDADDLPVPDFGGMWASTVGWFGSWFEE